MVFYLQLFRIQEDIKSLSKRRKSLRDSLQRHQKRLVRHSNLVYVVGMYLCVCVCVCVCVCYRKDKQLIDQVKEKLASVDSQLVQLQREEKTLERNITTKSEQKKLSIF